MSEKQAVQTAPDANPGTVRPSTGGLIEYKVFGRKFEPDSPPVLYLFATCVYPTGQWEIFFKGDGGFKWTLLERVPGLVNQLVTYYVAAATTSQPVLDIPPTVTITDARGSHQVPVEAWS